MKRTKEMTAIQNETAEILLKQLLINFSLDNNNEEMFKKLSSGTYDITKENNNENIKKELNSEVGIEVVKRAKKKSNSSRNISCNSETDELKIINSSDTFRKYINDETN